MCVGVVAHSFLSLADTMLPEMNQNIGTALPEPKIAFVLRLLEALSTVGALKERVLMIRASMVIRQKMRQSEMRKFSNSFCASATPSGGAAPVVSVLTRVPRELSAQSLDENELFVIWTS